MKKLLITLLLISPFSFADWGDVYYCQMTTHSKTSVEGNRVDYKLEKFEFQLNEAKNSMVFGKSSFFTSSEFELREGMSFLLSEEWYAADKYSSLYFDQGNFLYVVTGSAGSFSISAACDKF